MSRRSDPSVSDEYATELKAQESINTVTNLETTVGGIQTDGVARFPFLSSAQSPEELGYLGDYRILAVLGQGGMGVVFRAEDPKLKRLIALKVMRPEVAQNDESAERFLREGRAVAGLKSDHVITIYEANSANGVPFLAMEFLEGLPLDIWLQRQTHPIPLKHVLRIVRDTLRGLAAAHQKGLIHRDVKPANLWIEKSTSRIKLLDFGLTRNADHSDQMTVDGTIVGTPAYMAPEQASGRAVDARADLFSVGTVMYTLLTSKNPFLRDSLMATLGAVNFDHPKSVSTLRPDVPKEYSDFLDRLLSKDPGGRPQDAQVAFQELVAIATKLASAPNPATSEATPPTNQQVLANVSEAQGDKNAVGRGAYSITATQPEASTEATSARPPKTAVASLRIDPFKKIVLGGVLFGALLILGAIIIVITNKDGTKTTILVPEGASVEVKEDKSTARSGDNPRPENKSIEMDGSRKVAEFVIGRGGFVELDDGSRVEELKKLPRDNFKVLTVDLSAAKEPLKDAELEQFRSLAELTKFNAHGPITGQGLKCLEGKKLELVSIGLSEIRNADLSIFETMPRLSELSLPHSKITREGFANISKLRHLKVLNLYEIPAVTEESANEIQNWSQLEKLLLFSDSLHERTFESIAKLPKLTHLHCSNTPRFESIGLTYLAKSNTLEHIDLSSTPLADEGLLALTAIKTLKALFVVDTKVTAEGVQKFKSARPDVVFRSSFGNAN